VNALSLDHQSGLAACLREWALRSYMPEIHRMKFVQTASARLKVRNVFNVAGAA